MQESSIKYQVSNIKYQISSIKYQVSSIKYQVSSIKYQVSSIKYQDKKRHQAYLRINECLDQCFLPITDYRLPNTVTVYCLLFTVLCSPFTVYRSLNKGGNFIDEYFDYRSDC